MNARDYALAMLDRTALPGWRSNLIRRSAEPPADQRDLALAEQIRVGVIKNHTLLEHLIDHYARRPGRIDPLVRKIIAIGLYQLRFLTRIPPSAAVDEAVEQTRRFGGTKAAGFVNAVLRKALREPDVPLPDVSSQPEKHAAVVLSHPPQLIRRLVDLLDMERTIAFCRHDNAEPPTLVRLFRGVSPEQLKVGGVTITPHEQDGMLVVEPAKRATLASWAAAGLAQAQDATSAAVVGHLGIQTNHRVLDRCAGRGTKTLQMQEFIGEGGLIMAVDPSKQRCDDLRSLVIKRKLANVAVVQASMLSQVVDLHPPAFDRILIDAPCSNSGVLARRAEARYSQTPQALASLAQLQDEILDDTAPYLHPAGLLLYSTCSIWPEENERRVERFLDVHRDYRQLACMLTWPSFDADPTHYRDGGFGALLQRQ